MISKKTIEVIKLTAPVLKIKGEEITKVFYKILFEKHPELKDVFNMVNQKKGKQQQALANAVFKYAIHIDELEKLNDTIELIAQKHSSLSIPEEAYPIVGENLLIAIKEVLGDIATPEIMKAWSVAYESLATIFINREKELYKTNEHSIGGFKGMKEFVVINKVIESNTITSFYLKRKDGVQVPSFIPGQYIAITLSIPNTEHKHTRNYSLSDSNDKNYLRISVKKETGSPNGIVSNYLHTSVEIGAVLSIGMPSGNFVLKDTNKPVVFISGGVGITPLLSMYKEAVKKLNKVIFIQCVLNSDNQVFVKEITERKENHVKFVKVYSDPLVEDVLGRDYDYEGFISIEILKKLNISNKSGFYFCGPTPFMTSILKILDDLEVQKENINFEFFGPVEELALVN